MELIGTTDLIQFNDSGGRVNSNLDVKNLRDDKFVTVSSRFWLHDKVCVYVDLLMNLFAMWDCIYLLCIELFHFSDGLKRTVNFRNQRLWHHRPSDYTIIISRTLKVTGNHVKFARFVLFPVSEEAKTWLPFFFVQCVTKQLLDSVFVISRIIKVSVRISLWLIAPTSILITLYITKTWSSDYLSASWTLPDRWVEVCAG